MNIKQGNYEAVSNEILDISNDIYNEDFSRFALGRFQMVIQEESNYLNQFSKKGFSGWTRELRDGELEELYHQYDQFVGLLDNAKPFDNVLFDSSRILDLESSEVVRKLVVEPDVTEATIIDYDCGTGTRTLSIMRYLYEWNGVSALDDKEFILVAQDVKSLRLALIQILFHLHKLNLRVAKIAAYVSADIENPTIIGSQHEMIVYGSHNFNIDFEGFNPDHDCVIAETEHLLVLAP